MPPNAKGSPDGAAQVGGRIYGSGFYGVTMDAGHVAGDEHTLDSALKRASLEDTTFVLWLGPSKSVELKTESDVARLLKAVHKADDIVAKQRKMPAISIGTSLQASFVDELTAVDAVRGAFGPHVERCSTLAPLSIKGLADNVWGLETVNNRTQERTYYVFSTRCDLPINHLAFTPQMVVPFVSDILFGFAKLHAGGVFHNDVKFDNMIYCAKDQRYKLIDWGSSGDRAYVAKRIIKGTRPINSPSPFAWRAAGLSSWAPTLMRHNVSMRYMASLTFRPEFMAFLNDVHAAYDVELARFEAALPPGVSIDSDKGRKLMIDTYAPSFDLFSFGFMLAYLACTPSHLGGISDDRAAHDVVMALARKLTMFHADGLHNDAEKAYAWWKAQCKPLSAKRS